MSRRVATFLACSALATFVPCDVGARESLATPITGRDLSQLWPISVEVEIVRLADADSTQRAMLPRQRARVPDGQRFELASAVRTGRGRRHFAINVVARHHPDAIELEWNLEVSEAKYRTIGVGQYLLHRMQLADVIELDEPGLRIARSDIVTTRGEMVRERVVIDDEVHEIRISARSARG